MRDPGKFSFKPFFVILFLGLALVTGYVLMRDNFGSATVNSFEDCVKAGNPVMESYPQQCNDGQQTFVNTEQLAQ